MMLLQKGEKGKSHVDISIIGQSVKFASND